MPVYVHPRSTVYICTPTFCGWTGKPGLGRGQTNGQRGTDMTHLFWIFIIQMHIEPVLQYTSAGHSIRIGCFQTTYYGFIWFHWLKLCSHNHFSCETEVLVGSLITLGDQYQINTHGCLFTCPLSHPDFHFFPMRWVQKLWCLGVPWSILSVSHWGIINSQDKSKRLNGRKFYEFFQS